MHTRQYIEPICDFLRHIGLEVRETELPDDTFLPGIRIQGACLEMDPGKLAYPCDLLHEAGHIAVTPAALRASLMPNVNQSPGFGEHHNGEVEAIAWSYAACLHLGIDPRHLFHADGYKGHADALLNNFSFGAYIGTQGLQEAGLALHAQRARELGKPAYPAMLRWLRA